MVSMVGSGVGGQTTLGGGLGGRTDGRTLVARSGGRETFVAGSEGWGTLGSGEGAATSSKSFTQSLISLSATPSPAPATSHSVSRTKIAEKNVSIIYFHVFLKENTYLQLEW